MDYFTRLPNSAAQTHTHTIIIKLQYCHNSHYEASVCHWPPVALSVSPTETLADLSAAPGGFQSPGKVGVSFSGCARWISTHQCTGSRGEGGGGGGGGRFSNVKSVEINEAACEDESLLSPTLLPPPPRMLHILRLQQHNLSLPIITSTFSASLCLMSFSNKLSFSCRVHSWGRTVTYSSLSFNLAPILCLLCFAARELCGLYIERSK